MKDERETMNDGVISHFTLLFTSFFFNALQMKSVHEAMDEGSEKDSEQADEDETGEECVAGGEDFGGVAFQWVDRSHSAEDHRRVQQGIDPAQSAEETVTENAGEKGKGGGNDRSAEVPEDTQRE